MRYLGRLANDEELTKRLRNQTETLEADGATADIARRRWNSAREERSRVRSALALMALGIERCMYCGENLGTDIDHFEPISRAPLRTFDWLNHLLACSFCNSNQKRSAFPCDDAGNRLLIDPTSENPSDHLRLILQSGIYRDLTPKGTATIDIFDLNRRALVRGRQNAFLTRGAVLCYAQLLLASGRAKDAVQRLAALREEPHASVLWAMLHAAGATGAQEVLGQDVLAALKDPRIRKMIGAE
jgi:hypothetical protein